MRTPLALTPALSTEQRETLECWLFDENLGYAETLARVQKQLGVEATMASLGRYYRRRAQERQVGELALAQIVACQLNDLPLSVDSLRTAAVKLVGKAALKLASERPDQVEALAALTRLLLESEDIAVRRGRLALEERCFHFEETAAVQKELPQLRAYLAALGEDAGLTHGQKLERFHGILFGWDGARPGGKEPAKPSPGN